MNYCVVRVLSSGFSYVGLRRRLTVVYRVKGRSFNELCDAVFHGMYSVKRRRDQIVASLPGGISRVVERVFKVQVVEGGVGKPLNRKVLRSLPLMVKGGGLDGLCFDVVVKYGYRREAGRGFAWSDWYKVCFAVGPQALKIDVSHVKGLMRTELKALSSIILDSITLALRRRRPKPFL